MTEQTGSTETQTTASTTSATADTPTQSAQTTTATPGAPDKYADFAFAKDSGLALSPEVTGQVQALAKGLNLPQEQAQKLADFAAGWQKEADAKQQQNLTAMREDWKRAAGADPEIGGPNLATNLAIAKKAVEAFGGKELVDFLDQSGFGNHPVAIRTFVKIGKAMSEDKLVNAGEGAKPSLAESMYPSMKKA